MLTKQQLVEIGVVPKKFKFNQNIYTFAGFTPVKEVDDYHWKRLPLYIQVNYSSDLPHRLL